MRLNVVDGDEPGVAVRPKRDVRRFPGPTCCANSTGHSRQNGPTEWPTHRRSNRHSKKVRTAETSEQLILTTTSPRQQRHEKRLRHRPVPPLPKRRGRRRAPPRADDRRLALRQLDGLTGVRSWRGGGSRLGECELLRPLRKRGRANV